jgi:hypothetical protein
VSFMPRDSTENTLGMIRFFRFNPLRAVSG